MKTKLLSHFYQAVCLVSVICFCLPPLAAVLRADDSDLPAALSLGLLAGSAVLLLLPVAEEDSALSFWFSLGIAAVCLCGVSFPLPVRALTGGILLLHIVYLTVRIRNQYLQLRPLFRHMNVWYCVEIQARFFYTAVLYLLTSLFPDSLAPAWGRWLYLAAALLLFVLLWMRVRTGRTALIRPAKELEIKKLIRGNLRTAPPQAGDKTEDMSKMNQIYERAISLMEEKRLFLDSGLCLNDIAVATYTNKTYLSKTINALSGRNFKQFVNYYRVCYAAELMKKDPRIPVTNAAMMCGFNSTVSFNMAFKLNMGETPSGYKERIIVEKQFK